MRINFRQGLVSAEIASNGQPNYLVAGGPGISLRTTNRPVVFSAASGTKNYTISFYQDVLAWPTSMLTGITEGWLYIDINRATAARSYGVTTTEPSWGTVKPTSPVDNQHWYDLTTNTMKVYNNTAQAWIDAIRVFAGHYTTTLLSTYQVGSQVGIASTAGVISGSIMVDGFGVAITDSAGDFITTEENLYIDGAPTYAAKLEANVAVASAAVTIPKFHVVRFANNGTLELADYDDTGDKILGLAVVDANITEPVNIVLSGKVHNPLWNWGSANVTLWVGTNGELVAVDPFTVGGRSKARVAVARTIDAQTIIFDQGLGGKGEKGDAGDLTGLVNAAANVIGITKLSVDPDDFENPIAVGINDPLLTAPRVPIEHTHPATAITVSPFGTFSGSNAQQALEHLQTVKLNLSGGTVTGNIISTVQATQDNHLVTLGQTKNSIVSAAVTYKRFTLSDSASTIVQAFNALSPANRTYAVNTVVVCEWKQSVYFWAGGYGSPVSATDTSQFLLIGKLAGDAAPLTFRALESIAAYQVTASKTIFLILTLAGDSSDTYVPYVIDSVTGEMTQSEDADGIEFQNGMVELSTDNDLVVVARTDWDQSPSQGSVRTFSYPDFVDKAVVSQSGGGIALNNIGMVRLSKDGTRMAVTHNDVVGSFELQAATVYDTATGQVLFYVPAYQDWDTTQNTTLAAISPDGSKLAVRYSTTKFVSGTPGFDFALFDINTTQEIARYSGFRCVDVAFTQDGSKVIFTGTDAGDNTNQHLAVYMVDATNPPLTAPAPVVQMDSDWDVDIFPSTLNVGGVDYLIVSAFNQVTSARTFVRINLSTGEYTDVPPPTGHSYVMTAARWDNRLYVIENSSSDAYQAILEIDPTTWAPGDLNKQLVQASDENTFVEYFGVS